MPTQEEAAELLERYKQQKRKLREALIENGWRPTQVYRMTLVELQQAAEKVGL